MTEKGTKIRIGCIHRSGAAQVALRYSSGSARQGLKRVALRAGTKGPVTMHMLRHCDARNLLTSGTDIRYIQEALGHESLLTTEVCTHIARDIKHASPIDTLE